MGGRRHWNGQRGRAVARRFLAGARQGHGTSTTSRQRRRGAAATPAADIRGRQGRGVGGDCRCGRHDVTGGRSFTAAELAPGSGGGRSPRSCPCGRPRGRPRGCHAGRGKWSGGGDTETAKAAARISGDGARPRRGDGSRASHGCGAVWRGGGAVAHDAHGRRVGQGYILGNAGVGRARGVRPGRHVCHRVPKRPRRCRGRASPPWDHRRCCLGRPPPYRRLHHDEEARRSAAAASHGRWNDTARRRRRRGRSPRPTLQRGDPHPCRVRRGWPGKGPALAHVLSPRRGRVHAGVQRKPSVGQGASQGVSVLCSTPEPLSRSGAGDAPSAVLRCKLASGRPFKRPLCAQCRGAWLVLHLAQRLRARSGV
mmetsp:Transcript_5937/g.15109  ORF Transcript_5937/g.15109 Transcript_5937/m.15109 type:complete len:368 (-) Transcript_5937:1232-2335(-)